METIFSQSSLLVMPLWAAMILLPRWRWTLRALRSPWSLAPAAALYAALVLPRVGEVWPVVAQPTLDAVARLLASPEGATIAWAHFLAFDAFVGRWAYLDSRERGISPWVMAPVLFLTLMLGPVGFLLYLVVRELAVVRERVVSGAGATARGGGWVGAVRRGVSRGLAVDRTLTVVTLAMLLLLPVCMVGLVADPRQITGVPAWLKPAKFAISTLIYCATLLWMLSLIRGHRRLVRVVGVVTGAGLAVEVAIIVLQAVRGTTSHFNVSTALDATLFSVMGAIIVLVWAMNLLVVVLLVRQRFADRAFAWSLRLGATMSLVGGLVAVPMLDPTPEQLTALRAGERPVVVGAHSVGVADGGAGLPVTGWSTEGGDLRVPHFVALHGLQLLPLLGWVVARRRRPGEGHRVALVWIAGVGYLGLTSLLLWQALRGEPVVAPGPATLSALGLLAGVVGVAVEVVLAHARRAERVAAPVLVRAG